MVGALLSTLGKWWDRLWGRKTAARPNANGSTRPAGSGEANRAETVIGSLTLAATPSATTEQTSEQLVTTTPTEVERHDTEKSLIEVLCVEALPVPQARPRAVDPAVRERTLAALNSLRQIPALQSLAQEFLRAMNQQEVSVPDVVASVEKDSALCVRILRMANSVLVSPERRIEDLESAVQMLGVARVRNAAQALFTLRGANRVAEGFDWHHLWIHALGTAAIAEELEQQLRTADDSQVHLAGLLHDVGKIVLSTIAPDAYRDVLIVAWNENGRLEDLEREHLGVDHREAGVMFAQHNNLPPVVVEAIAHHNKPEEAKEHRFEVALVAIANYLCKAHGLGFSGARLDDADGDFAELSAWDIVEETCGFRPNADAVEAEMGVFIANLRTDLKALRETN